MRVWIVVDCSRCAVERVFKTKKSAIEFLRQNNLKKYGNFWAENKNSIHTEYFYTINSYNVHN